MVHFLKTGHLKWNLHVGNIQGVKLKKKFRLQSARQVLTKLLCLINRLLFFSHVDDNLFMLVLSIYKTDKLIIFFYIVFHFVLFKLCVH